MGFWDILFGEKATKRIDRRKRVFISFAIEDEKYRDFLIAQARNSKSPFDFIDMSVKEPWEEDEWKRRCKTKIKRSHGVIALLSNHTHHSSGARWEMKCAVEEEIPIIGMHIKKNQLGAIPKELAEKKIILWRWDEINNFLKSL
jgi:hypothetical protein